ncbi:MAG: TonB-dependent receptor, partial [Candidatus Eremiobacteraeota bacterium]|nr:TonB-dependent receptor [Candidatus Eremiobacteraeota bacterium]
MRRGVAALLLSLAFVLQGTTSVLAGTTGTISGSLVDTSTNRPISGAQVSATSPSQTASTTTDAAGRFSFVSLAPDTYTIGVAATGTYDAASVSGVTVQADQTLSVSLQQSPHLKQIGSVTSRAASSLVKPGTTADVYAIDAVTQDKSAALGGGGSLNSAWSAISSVPGVYVAPNQNGYIGAAPALSIRGGAYDQIGYELDGIPVNRAFDNYPSGALSSLGQQELQVYTGATPANSEANGISGYINQVIRAGTAPASRNLTFALGTPTLYNKLAFEAGGANPSRTFSYYLGAGAYNQAFRYYDQYNGASLQTTWGAPLAPCSAGLSRGEAPSCFTPSGVPYTNSASTPSYVLGPPFLDAVSGVQDRDTIVNLHFGIPQKNGNHDDVQLLFDNNFINNKFYSSTNDLGGPGFTTDVLGGPPAYFDGLLFTGAPLGTVLPGNYSGGGVQTYLFPDSPGGRAVGAPIPFDRQDAFVNNQSVLKLQYQHNFGTSAFLRVYGYTYYSDWLQNGPQSNDQNYLGAVPSQYLLDSHTRGASMTFSDQITPQHLLTAQGSYATATTLRDNNTTFAGPAHVGFLVDSSNPYSGLCYNPVFTGGVYSGTNTSAPCSAGSSYSFSLGNALNDTVTPATTFGTCGGGPCRYVLAENGSQATYNTVAPRFYAASVTDQWKPTDRLSLNLGLRMDRFEFHGADTTGSPARALWYNAYNLANGTNVVDVPNQVEGYTVFQPRAGVTYTLDPRTVLRASYGRYAEAPNSAYEQYNY